MNAAPTLRTARLELRPLTAPGQVDALMRASELAHAGQEPARTPEERGAYAARTVERSAEAFAAHGFGLWMLHRAGEQEPCGWCGLRNGEHPAGRRMPGGIEYETLRAFPCSLPPARA